MALAARTILLGLIFVVGQSGAETLLNILGMFPDPSASSSILWPDGFWCIPAAQLAVDHVNNQSVLSGYSLVLQPTISGCRRNPAVETYIRNVVQRNESESPPIAILGPGCSSSTLPVASLVSGSSSRLVQISYGATSPSLSNIKAFPSFFRTVMPNSALSRTMTFLLRHLGWSNVATLYEDNSILRSTALSLHSWLSNLIPNGKVLHSSLVTSSTIEYDLRQIRASNGRIIFAFSFQRTAREILCQAYRQSMIYPRYVWIFPEHYSSFWQIEKGTTVGGCTYEEFQQAARGTLGFIFGTETTEKEKILISGINFTEFHQQYTDKLNSFVAAYNASTSGSLRNPVNPGFQFYRTVTYDAVWTLALALNDTNSVLKESYNTSLMSYGEQPNLVSDVLRRSMEKVKFQGASGFVDIHDQHFSYLPVFFSQAVESDDGEIAYRFLGQQIFTADYPDGTDLQFFGQFIWKSSPPSDRFQVVVTNPAGTPLGVIVILAAIVTFAANTASMLVNYFYRFNILLKTSSPAMNWFIFSGNYFLLLGVVLYSALMLNPGYCSTYYGLLCNVFPWAISIGYSLVIATVSVKCFRLYLIFHQANKMSSGQRVMWMLKDISLMIIICIIVGVDAVLLVVWNATDPLSKNTVTMVNVEQGIEEEIPSCHLGTGSSPYLIAAIIAWKFLLSLSVTFFAWQMRSIKIKDFDNAGTAFTFLLVNLILSVVSILIVFFLISNQIASTIPVYVYVVTSIAILISVWSSLVILLFYKQRTLLTRGPDGKYLFMSTFSTRGAVGGAHRESIASRTTLPSNLSEHFSNVSVGAEAEN